MVSWRGRWYLVGHDRDRGATRCFRVSRIVGDVATAREAGRVQRPADADLLHIVAGDQRRQPIGTQARIWALPDRAQGLRRESTIVATQELDGELGDVLELEVRSPESAASWIASYGPDVVVLEPDTLRKAVHEVHAAVLEAGAR
jgi:proteasome accessory factor B